MSSCLIHPKCRGLLLIVIILSLIFIVCSKKIKVNYVGILCGLDFFCNTVDGFKEKMAELGYIEGKNIKYNLQKSHSDSKLAKQILEKFVAEKVDLIFVLPTDVSIAAKVITKGTNIPVVFSNANVEEQGLINNIREPGGNITGVRYPGPDLTIKRFEIMRELYPKAKRIWVPYKRGLGIVPSQLKVLRSAAESAGVKLMESPANDVKEIKQILKKLNKSADIGIDAILMIAEPLVVTPSTFLEMAKFSEKHKIPIGGALMSVEGYNSIFGVSTDNISVGRQAATLADKIFKGINAGTIPVVSAENYIQINFKVAKQFGIKISEGLLKQANKIIR